MELPQTAFGDDESVAVETVDIENGEATLRLVVEPHHIASSGVLDEGVVATITDLQTTYLLVAETLSRKPSRMPVSVSVSISVQTIRPVAVGTVVEIVCTVSPDPIKPHAVAVFRSAVDPGIVFAVGRHSKQFKDMMGYASNPGKL
ncbi:hypothetical protein GGI25_002002 [Coemansia spiralis]|uniref:Thioesterase domain-containing protein n=2 Tax=Coemansia TaxID=4863 RepID=A0A9W8G9G4_9FUNG|nr:hypothetical protein BX070DRAFT_254010 [Coemansia spiralis]KAJ1992669.1 hypothetical protein EDC05_002612 [Coemansia umbellata]KAJ2623258.1 hypothetical protein GGI26_002485 [Coemansia sp. RSA 1358]KAJ2678810.1 hypothetical protein GGI25_002002 [Coemansia spiralis]